MVYLSFKWNNGRKSNTIGKSNTWACRLYDTCGHSKTQFSKNTCFDTIEKLRKKIWINVTINLGNYGICETHLHRQWCPFALKHTNAANWRVFFFIIFFFFIYFLFFNIHYSLYHLTIIIYHNINHINQSINQIKQIDQSIKTTKLIDRSIDQQTNRSNVQNNTQSEIYIFKSFVVYSNFVNSFLNKNVKLGCSLIHDHPFHTWLFLKCHNHNF